MENTQTQPTMIIKSGSGIGIGGALIGLAALAALGYGGYKLIQQGKENSAEAKLDTPEGQIALQLKNVFDKWPVSDSDYKAAWLQVNATNKDEIFKIYRNLTGRNLSDDIASHVSSGAQAQATKTEKYNSKPGKLFSIDSGNNIKWEIAKGDKIRFAPGQVAPINVYTSPFGIILNDIKSPDLFNKLRKDPKTVALTISISVKPTAKLYPVLAIKEIPYDGMKQADDNLKYLRPYIKVRKVFAAVQVLAGINATTKKPIIWWIDARDMVTFKQQIKGTEGIGSVNLIA